MECQMFARDAGRSWSCPDHVVNGVGLAAGPRSTTTDSLLCRRPQRVRIAVGLMFDLKSNPSANSAISAIISKAIGVAIRYTGEARLYSIDRDRWIDLVTPSLNATLHALGLGKSQLPQRFSEIQTATAGMTVNYNGLAAEFLNVWQPGIHLLDRQQSSSRNSTELVLV